jgi:hypothetical protein
LETVDDRSVPHYFEDALVVIVIVAIATPLLIAALIALFGFLNWLDGWGVPQVGRLLDALDRRGIGFIRR